MRKLVRLHLYTDVQVTDLLALKMKSVFFAIIQVDLKVYTMLQHTTLMQKYANVP